MYMRCHLYTDIEILGLFSASLITQVVKSPPAVQETPAVNLSRLPGANDWPPRLAAPQAPPLAAGPAPRRRPTSLDSRLPLSSNFQGPKAVWILAQSPGEAHPDSGSWKPQADLIRMHVHRRYPGPASHEPASRGPSGLRPGSPPEILERLRSSCGDAGRAGCRLRGGGPWADCRGPTLEGIRDWRVPRAAGDPEGDGGL